MKTHALAIAAVLYALLCVFTAFASIAFLMDIHLGFHYYTQRGYILASLFSAISSVYLASRFYRCVKELRKPENWQ